MGVGLVADALKDNRVLECVVVDGDRWRANRVDRVGEEGDIEGYRAARAADRHVVRAGFLADLQSVCTDRQLADTIGGRAQLQPHGVGRGGGEERRQLDCPRQFFGAQLTTLLDARLRYRSIAG